MLYHYRFYLWEKGQKTVEYTNYLTFPIFYEDRLNEELDSGEIILDKMPISTKNKFPPKTKFRLERYKKDDFSDIPKSWDLVVEHDDVETYLGVPNLCCHRISFLEPSVVAQGMHVDNIALTYELQDVTTNYKTYNSDSTRALVDEEGAGSSLILRETRYEDDSQTAATGSTSTRNAYFKNSYAYIWDQENLKSLKEIKLNLEVSQRHNISFKIPKLYIYGSTNGQSWDKKLFELNTRTNIYKYETQNGRILSETKTLVISQNHGPSQIDIADNEWFFSDGNVAALRVIDNTVVKSDDVVIRPGTETDFKDLYLKAPIIAQVKDYQTDVINFVTESLNEEEILLGKGYFYEVEILADPINSDGLLLHYEASFFALSSIFTSYPYTTTKVGEFLPEIKENADKNSIFVKTSFNIFDMSQDVEAGYLIMKGVKYSCYDLLRKALLTIDTQIINNDEIGIDEIQYSIILDPAWENRLKTAKVQETTLETKNLWEVLLQIGYYIHAIPYLSFSEDGTDRFVLSFRQLGDISNKRQENSAKITIFNSKNLNDYFSQYDSYVTNIFSPQNLVDEWLVIKTNDSSSLVCNNTAILKTSYGISEIVDFEITYNGSSGGESGTKSALSHIFEKSIYQILTADYNISPGMGDSLYYELGKNEISGLTYVPPSVNNDKPMALKRIVGKLFSGVAINNLKFNDLKFHITYRTQDSIRISQVRPDIHNFMKNSLYEKYPHHEQFYGQQDKIVDSERLSLNLFGKLVRVGNDIYQRQEMVINYADEIESGNLIEIAGEPFYATEIENEFYPDAIFQKITYSKNFNQLSYIVTIPSEPRFYEVSERSTIRREIRLFDFFKISTSENPNSGLPRFLSNSQWQKILSKIIFNIEKIKLPNYAWTRFKADKFRRHKGFYNQFLSLNQMFPSSELDRSNPNQVMPKASSDHSDVIVPLLHFPMKDGISFEWDMLDNFKAGDSIDTSISGEKNTVDEAYYATQSVRYCDIFGRADLFTFKLFNKIDWTHNQSQELPKACIEPEESDSFAFLPLNFSIALDKDCRCALSFNYQINLLYNPDFVTFSNLFGDKKSKLFCCLLDKEVTMFNENINVISATILADNINYYLIENYEKNQLEIQIEHPESVNLQNVKSLVFYEIDDENNKVSYFAKNYKDGISDSIPKLYIYPFFNE